jgi:hypothetical protein
MNWKKKATSPPVSRTLRNREGRNIGSPPRASTRPSQRKSAPISSKPARISQITMDTPASEGAPGLARTRPHTPTRRTPNTVRKRPAIDSPAPTKSNEIGSALMSCSRRRKMRITNTITTSPTNTHRHDANVVTAPPISGPAATPMAPAAAIRP